MQLVCHACMDYTVNYNFFAFLCVLVNNPFRKDNLKEKITAYQFGDCATYSSNVICNLYYVINLML